MKAIVWKEDGTLQGVTNWKEKKIDDDQILVKIKAAGVCTTDIHMVRGNLDFANPPWVLGHEMSGVVEKIGINVKGWNVGDQVIVDPVVSCGSCRYCLSGKKYLCKHGGELGTTLDNGGYGEYVIVNPQNLYPLPDEMSFEEGAMMEPLNCTLGAIHKVPDIAGKSAIVFGSGPAGLLFLQLAKAYGAIKVTLVGLDDKSLELGKKLGADKVVNISKENLEDLVTDDEYEIAIEASGSVEAVKDCFKYVASSGTVVLYGLNGLKIHSIESDLIVRKDLTIITSISAPLLWEKGINLVKSGRVNVKDIITERVLFNDADKLINRLVNNSYKTIKVIVCYE